MEQLVALLVALSAPGDLRRVDLSPIIDLKTGYCDGTGESTQVCHGGRRITLPTTFASVSCYLEEGIVTSCIVVLSCRSKRCFENRLNIIKKDWTALVDKLAAAFSTDVTSATTKCARIMRNGNTRIVVWNNGGIDILRDPSIDTSNWVNESSMFHCYNGNAHGHSR